MTIRSLRLYLEFEDKLSSRMMNRAHFGATYWFNARLKTIRQELRGAEMKGVDIVNVWLCEDSARCTPLDLWYRMLNAVEFKCVYDVRSLITKDPVENITNLRSIVSGTCTLAPWPQVRAIGRELQRPLGAEDVAELRRSLNKWATLVDRGGRDVRDGELH